MKATVRNIILSGTPSKTTLPLALTKDFSATGKSPALVLSNHILHRLSGDALEFVNYIVELLERDGGLAA